MYRTSFSEHKCTSIVAPIASCIQMWLYFASEHNLFAKRESIAIKDCVHFFELFEEFSRTTGTRSERTFWPRYASFLRSSDGVVTMMSLVFHCETSYFL